MQIDKEQLQKELESIATIDINRYLSIRESYMFQMHTGYEEIRAEICACITFGACQAAITLTNHYLEKFLKHSLIYMKSNFKQLQSLGDLASAFKEPKKWYSEQDLSFNIDQAKKCGLISKKEAIVLDEFREKFRNAYGHADMNKTFGDQSGNFWAFNFSEIPQSAPEPTNIKMSDFLPLQGHAQKQNADLEALPYFQYIDALVIRIETKRHPDIVNYPEAHRRLL